MEDRCLRTELGQSSEGVGVEELGIGDGGSSSVSGNFGSPSESK
jgi:hypothetical protein